MKTLKRRIQSFVLVISFILTLFPATPASAAYDMEHLPDDVTSIAQRILDLATDEAILGKGVTPGELIEIGAEISLKAADAAGRAFLIFLQKLVFQLHDAPDTAAQQPVKLCGTVLRDGDVLELL